MPVRGRADGYALAPYPIVYRHPQIPRHVWVEGADGVLYAVPNDPVGWERRRPAMLPPSPSLERLSPDGARRALGFIGVPAAEVRHG